MAVSDVAYPYYTFINAEQITQLVPPTGTQLAYQITGADPTSGVVFVGIVTQKMYETDPAGTAAHMGYLGSIFHNYYNRAHVKAMSTLPVIDQNNNVQYWLQVTVSSTSGNSTTQILVPYPSTADFTVEVAAFQAQLTATVKQLDAVEAA